MKEMALSMMILLMMTISFGLNNAYKRQDGAMVIVFSGTIIFMCYVAIKIAKEIFS